MRTLRARGRRRYTLALAHRQGQAEVTAMACDLGVLEQRGLLRRSSGRAYSLGLTTPDPVVADVKAQALEVSGRRVFMEYHSKLGAGSFCRFAEVGDLEAIVTDPGLSSAAAHRRAPLGSRVLRI